MIRLNKKEYGSFLRAVNKVYFARFKNKEYGTIIIDDKEYLFRIIDFNEYEVLRERKIN